MKVVKVGTAKNAFTIGLGVLFQQCTRIVITINDFLKNQKTAKT
jgi:hypothetical protein